MESLNSVQDVNVYEPGKSLEGKVSEKSVTVLRRRGAACSESIAMRWADSGCLASIIYL